MTAPLLSVPPLLSVRGLAKHYGERGLGGGPGLRVLDGISFDVARGVRIRVMQADATDFQPGALAQPGEIARLASPLAVDNLEGIAATRGARGETLLWLISDANFNRMQRKLLLLFELEK